VSRPIAQDATEREIATLEALLRSPRPYFGFISRLETDFRRHMQVRFLEMLQRGQPTILVFYALLGLCTYAEVQALSHPSSLAGNLQVWRAIYLGEGGVVAGLLLLPRLVVLLGHFHLCATLLAMAAILIVAVGTSAFSDPYFNQHCSYVVIFVLALVHGIGLFRMLPAILVSGLATLLAWLVIVRFELWLDQGLFLQYMLTASLVGALLSFIVEQRSRRSFLQDRLLQLERDQLDTVAGELARQSREDALTGLANRHHFSEVLQAEWERARREAQPLALVFIDLDCFRAFNEAEGYLEGDAVLAAFGNLLHGCLHRPADLAVRFGGEEFVLLLPGTPLAGALAVARHVQDALRALAIPHPASPVAGCVTASIGVAALEPSSELRSEQLLGWADEAAHAAKSAGRNCIRIAGSGDRLAVEPA
jgi:diguanylate cyclase (GGDEF)-like protein